MVKNGFPNPTSVKMKILVSGLGSIGCRHFRSLIALGEKETRPITLEFWGESESALDGYRELGFEMVNHYIAYHKELK